MRGMFVLKFCIHIFKSSLKILNPIGGIKDKDQEATPPLQKQRGIICIIHLLIGYSQPIKFYIPSVVVYIPAYKLLGVHFMGPIPE